MAKGMKAIVAAVALGTGLFGAARGVRADTEYTFNYASNSQNSMTASGIFNLDGVNITSVKANFYGSNSVKDEVTLYLESTFGSTIVSSSENSYNINAVFGYKSENNSVWFQGILNKSDGKFSGDSIAVVDGTSGKVSTGLFTAIADAIAPTASSGGSSPSTGSAPSPEVNALLGFLVVGGTVAFLKRRRREAEDTAAA